MTDPDETDTVAFSREQHDLLIAHYERVAPLLERSFGGTPFVAGFVPDWTTKRMVFEEGLRDPPASIATVDVATLRGPIAFSTVTPKALLWQAHRGAISFLGWSPVRNDPSRIAFGRVLLEPCGLATIAMVKEGALVVRALLQSTDSKAYCSLGDLPVSHCGYRCATRPSMDPCACGSTSSQTKPRALIPRC